MTSPPPGVDLDALVADTEKADACVRDDMETCRRPVLHAEQLALLLPHGSRT